MPNDLGTLNTPVLVQEMLERLRIEHPELMMFTRNFSNAALKKGQTLTVKKAAAATGAEFNPANGFTAQAATLVDAELALSKHYHATFSITEDERNKGALQWKSDFIAALMDGVVESMYAAIFDGITTGGATPTIGEDNVSVVAANDMNRNALIGFGQKMSEAGCPTRAARFALLAPSHYGKLMGDTSIVSALVNTGAGAAITEGRLPKVHNFSIAEYVGLKNDATPHFIRGIYGLNSAIGVVAAVPVAPSQGGKATVVTDSVSGLSLQIREWSDWNAGVDYISVQALFGSEILSADRLFAVTSEAPVTE